MVATWRMKLLTLVVFGLASDAGLCTVAPQRVFAGRDIKAWAERVLRSRPDALSGAYPKRVVFAHKLVAGKNAELLSFDDKEFNEIGFVQATSSKDLSWAFKINQYSPNGRKELAAKSVTALEKSIVDLMKASSADAVIHAKPESDATWDVYTLRDGRPSILVSAPAPSDRASALSLHEWLNHTFGYDGIVLDQDKEYVLVASSQKLIGRENVQALVYSGSEAYAVLPKGRQGQALLQRVATKDYFGVFRVLYTSTPNAPLPNSAKLAVERIGD